MNFDLIRLPDGTAPHFISKPLTNQTQDQLLIQLELEANPTPSVSWYQDTKDLHEADARFVTRIEKKSADKFLLSLEIKVSRINQSNSLIASFTFIYRIPRTQMLACTSVS